MTVLSVISHCMVLNSIGLQMAQVNKSHVNLSPRLFTPNSIISWGLGLIGGPPLCNATLWFIAPSRAFHRRWYKLYCLTTVIVMPLPSHKGVNNYSKPFLCYDKLYLNANCFLLISWRLSHCILHIWSSIILDSQIWWMNYPSRRRYLLRACNIPRLLNLWYQPKA